MARQGPKLDRPQPHLRRDEERGGVDALAARVEVTIVEQEQRERRKIKVDREWFNKLMEYLQPGERFIAHNGGLILFTAYGDKELDFDPWID
jgi:hypothetical protein